MPVVLRHDGFRFFFYSNEGSPREPPHIHVSRDRIDAKFWLWPEVKLADNDGFNAKVLRELTEVIEKHRGKISETWDEFFGRS